jgi:hypothetical protein
MTYAVSMKNGKDYSGLKKTKKKTEQINKRSITDDPVDFPRKKH